MSKQEGSDALSKMNRLFRLVRYLVDRGENGATFEDIAQDVYEVNIKDGDKAANEKVRVQFRRDRKDLLGIYKDDDEDLPEGDEELDEGIAIITKVRRKLSDGNSIWAYTIRSGLNLMLPMRLTKNQALALTSSVHLVKNFIAPFDKASRELSAKLQNQMSRELREECDVLTNSIVPAIPIAKNVKAEIIESIMDAISRKKLLHVIGYKRVWKTDPEGSFHFAPYVLYLKYHSWYVLGMYGSEEKILRVDRINLSEVSEEDQPQPCEGKALKKLQDKIRLGYDPSKDEPSPPKDGWPIKLKVTGTFKDALIETQWFEGEKKTKKDKSVIYEVRLWGLYQISLFIMRSLDCIEVLEPPELKKMIDDRVNQYLSRRNGQSE